jgi:hypothetical protein
MSPANVLRWLCQGWARRQEPSRPGRPEDRFDLPRPAARRPDRADPRARGRTSPAADGGGEETIDWDFLWIDLGGEG